MPEYALKTADGGRIHVGRIQVARHEYAAALEKYRVDKYSAEQLDQLQWFWGWIHSEEIQADMARIATMIRYDTTNIVRILRGRYDAKIDNFLLAVQDLRHELERRHAGFASTCVTRAIETKLEITRRHRYLTLICGPTGRSKTLTATNWAHRHNHGRTTYVRCRSGCTRTKLIRRVCEATGQHRTAGMNTAQMEESVFAWFNDRQRKVLIIDEINHLFRRKSNLAVAEGFEFVRDLYDLCNCAVVMIMTAYDMTAFKTGPLSGFFEQFRGRIQCYFRIPDQVFFDEVRALCAVHWPQPAEDLVEAAHNIATGHDGRLRTVADLLAVAAEKAKASGKAPTGKQLQALWRQRRDGDIEWPEK